MSSQPRSPIRFSCPHCGGNVKVPPQQAGHKCRCPRCDADIIAPGGALAAPPQPPTAAAPPSSVASSRGPGVTRSELPPGAAAPPAGSAAPRATAAASFPASATAPTPGPAGSPADPFAEAVYPQPGSAAESLRPAPRAGIPRDNDEFGIDCRVCGTRLHVRRSQIGDTVKCPDCHTPLVVKAPPIRKQAQPTDYEEAELFKLSEPVELPSTTYVPPGTSTEGAVSGAPPTTGTPAGVRNAAGGIAAGGGTAMQNAARALLEKARIQQEQEEAEEREHSAERFTQGLLAFFADPQALVRLGGLAVWFEVSMILFRWALGIRVSEDAPAALAETTSLMAMVALAVVGLGFLYAAAACGLALVQDSSNGLRRIENWPRANLLTWGRDVFYVINAWFLAALPGAMMGILLGLAGIKGAVLFTAAASFAGLFPPILLSMLESNSALAPVSNEVWVSIRERPDPWRLTYLITTVITLGGLGALVVSLISGFLVGLLGAVAMVACMMFYFRTVGWLICFLAGRDKGVAA